MNRWVQINLSDRGTTHVWHTAILAGPDLLVDCRIVHFLGHLEALTNLDLLLPTLFLLLNFCFLCALRNLLFACSWLVWGTFEGPAVCFGAKSINCIDCLQARYQIKPLRQGVILDHWIACDDEVSEVFVLSKEPERVDLLD